LSSTATVNAISLYCITADVSATSTTTKIVVTTTATATCGN
jgi:hypothetical protein